MSKSKARGTAWESEIVKFLRACGWPHVERRSLNGANDRGDITGIPGVVVEAKAHAQYSGKLAGWLVEAETERLNDGSEVGVVWFKRRGKATAGDGFVLMDGKQFAWLLNEAGFGNAGGQG